jgi:hypothetical protein
VSARIHCACTWEYDALLDAAVNNRSSLGGEWCFGTLEPPPQTLCTLGARANFDTSNLEIVHRHPPATSTEPLRAPAPTHQRAPDRARTSHPQALERPPVSPLEPRATAREARAHDTTAIMGTPLRPSAPPPRRPMRKARHADGRHMLTRTSQLPKRSRRR